MRCTQKHSWANRPHTLCFGVERARRGSSDFNKSVHVLGCGSVSLTRPAGPLHFEAFECPTEAVVVIEALVCVVRAAVI